MSCYYCEGEPTCRTCADLDERMGEEALVAYHGRHYAKYLLDRRRVAEEKLTRIAETIDHYQAVVDAARAWAGDYAAISDDSPPEDRALFDAVRALDAEEGERG